MPNYSEGKIYKLVNSVDETIYIGSTCATLTTRISKHRDKSRRTPDRPIYKHLNDIGWENIRIVLIDNVNCANKDELLREEQKHIDIYKKTNIILNKYGAIPDLEKQKQNAKENRPKYEANRDKEHSKQVNKEYYQNNKEHIIQRTRANQLENAEDRREYLRQYRDSNKDKAKDYAKAHYEQRKGEKSTCPHCDLELLKGSLSRHIKRKH